MGQDLRKIFETERETEKFPLRSGHEDRFLQRLENEFPQKRKTTSFFWLKIAASVLVLISTGLLAYQQWGREEAPIKTTVVDQQNSASKTSGISFGDLSPDLRKVENYYVAQINLELSRLEVSEANKNMVDGFMGRLAELDSEYKLLNAELNQIGPNDQTINALIKNLQLKLQLLHKLKEKLNELKSSKNEQQANTL